MLLYDPLCSSPACLALGLKRPYYTSHLSPVKSDNFDPPSLELANSQIRLHEVEAEQFLKLELDLSGTIGRKKSSKRKTSIHVNASYKRSLSSVTFCFRKAEGEFQRESC